jgi:hypothetical protein
MIDETPTKYVRPSVVVVVVVVGTFPIDEPKRNLFVPP